MPSTASEKKAGVVHALTAREARAIAKDAYVYGFPLVDNYRIQYSYFVDTKNPEYKCPWNVLSNTARVYTPDDKAIQSPNSDTPYSFLGADLRTEPLVISMLEIEKGRYYSAQFIDMYTFNFAYLGSRTTGNEAGDFLLAGPTWTGDIPQGIKKVFRCETEFAMVLIRTQLFNPADIENVKKIQTGYKVQPLSVFLGTDSPKPAPKINFIKPLSARDERSSLQFFNILNFVLQFCPTHVTEQSLMERFARLGIIAGKAFDENSFSPEIKKAIEEGIEDAWLIEGEVYKLVASGKVSSADVFGSRDALTNNYPYRMSAAARGIYGNSKEEAIYPVYYVDGEKNKMNGSAKLYTLRFKADEFPPVNAFWSLTLYSLPDSLLYANKLNRYLINSPMLSSLQKDADGGVTIYIQNESPGKDKESNWLPAPSGPFFCAMRLYWPKKEVLDGTWKAPPLEPQPGK